MMLVSFGTVVLSTKLAPYGSSDDDHLALLCHLQVFFALVSMQWLESLTSRWQS
jgi:hypothetical protein